MEQERTAGLRERQITQLIQNHQIDIQQTERQLPLLAGGFLLLQRVNQFHRREETHPFSQMPDCLIKIQRAQFIHF